MYYQWQIYNLSYQLIKSDVENILVSHNEEKLAMRHASGGRFSRRQYEISKRVVLSNA